MLAKLVMAKTVKTRIASEPERRAQEGLGGHQDEWSLDQHPDIVTSLRLPIARVGELSSPPELARVLAALVDRVPLLSHLEPA